MSGTSRFYQSQSPSTSTQLFRCRLRLDHPSRRASRTYCIVQALGFVPPRRLQEMSIVSPPLPRRDGSNFLLCRPRFVHLRWGCRPCKSTSFRVHASCRASCGASQRTTLGTRQSRCSLIPHPSNPSNQAGAYSLKACCALRTLQPQERGTSADGLPMSSYRMISHPENWTKPRAKAKFILHLSLVIVTAQDR